MVLLYTRFFEYDLNRVARIVAETIKHNARTEFVVVGKGRYEEHDKFAAEIQSLGLTGSVHMVGWVEFDELPNYFAAADVAIYPFDDTLINRSKCPAKLTELLVAGVPVVADNVGQISEYIHHDESGVLVEPGNEERFVKEILRFIDESQRRDKIAEAARNRMLTKFSWSSITDKVEGAYEVAGR